MDVEAVDLLDVVIAPAASARRTGDNSARLLRPPRPFFVRRFPRLAKEAVEAVVGEQRREALGCRTTSEVMLIEVVAVMRMAILLVRTPAPLAVLTGGSPGIDMFEDAPPHSQNGTEPMKSRRIVRTSVEAKPNAWWERRAAALRSRTTGANPARHTPERCQHTCVWAM
jgi:hypothetical protein